MPSILQQEQKLHYAVGAPLSAQHTTEDRSRHRLACSAHFNRKEFHHPGVNGSCQRAQNTDDDFTHVHACRCPGCTKMPPVEPKRHRKDDTSEDHCQGVSLPSSPAVNEHSNSWRKDCGQGV